MTGFVSKDTVTIGNYSMPSQPFGESTFEDEKVFGTTPSDGILGLAFPGLAEDRIIPVFDNMVNHGILPADEFSFYFGRDPRSDASMFILGGRDPRYTYSFVPLSSELYWAVPLDDVYMGAMPLALCSEGCSAVIDTGTSLIVGPPSTVKTLTTRLLSLVQMKASVKKGDMLYWDCAGVKNLPPLNFRMAGQDFSLDPSDYVISVDDGSGGVICTLALASQDFDPQIWILGDVFLRAHYVVFDRAHNAVGFAPADKSSPSLLSRFLIRRNLVMILGIILALMCIYYAFTFVQQWLKRDRGHVLGTQGSGNFRYSTVSQV